MPEFKVIIFAVVALAVLVGSLAWKYQLANYEFRNRGEGGLIGFRSLPHSWLHSLMKLVSWLTLIVGIVMTLQAVIYIF